MKSFETIEEEAASRDFYVVAEIAGCTGKNVQMVVRRLRRDNFNIQLIFSEYLRMKDDLKRYRKK